MILSYTTWPGDRSSSYGPVLVRPGTMTVHATVEAARAAAEADTLLDLGKTVHIREVRDGALVTVAQGHMVSDPRGYYLPACWVWEDVA